MSIALKINVESNVLVGAIIIKQAKKDVKWALKIVKIEEIFMFYH
jgi:hypothetical protein